MADEKTYVVVKRAFLFGRIYNPGEKVTGYFAKTPSYLLEEEDFKEIVEPESVFIPATVKEGQGFHDKPVGLTEREDAIREAKSLGIEFPKNAKTEYIKKLIEENKK